MSTAEELPEITFAEFLRHEHASQRRHELVGGRIYVMSGGSERHDLVAGLVYEALAPGARSAGCRPFTSNRLVKMANAAYYPDAMVVCGPAADRHWERDADFLVEVLSPSTRDVDRREKAAAYATLPSPRGYLLVDPDQRRMELATKGPDGLRWQAYGPGHVVFTPFGPLVVDDLYDAVDRTATTS